MLKDLSHGQLTSEYLCLTTFGQDSGRRQSAELWFVAEHDTVFVLATRGTRAGWVRNIQQHPAVELRSGRTVRTGRAHVVTEPAEATRIRRLILCKYQPVAAAKWAATALPVAIELS